LNDFPDEMSRFHAVLSTDERMRAGRFHFARDRDRFIACRGILRELLARYLHQDAATIQFSYGPHGKPDLAGGNGHHPLFFNASHAGALAIYAVTSVCPVGVDVEHLREIPDFDAIASRFFAPSETGRLTALPPAQRLEEFFACWTWKEAFLKATGEGIGVHLATCPPSGWQLRRLRPTQGYVGALVYRHSAARLSFWSASNATLSGSGP
jgi:4'-phosphopantetheinyl transferase